MDTIAPFANNNDPEEPSMSVRFHQTESEIRLIYHPEMQDWLGERIGIAPDYDYNTSNTQQPANNPWPISLWGGVFEFSQSDLIDAEFEGQYIFLLGAIKNEAPYYFVEGRKLKIPFDVYLSTDMRISTKHFGAGPARWKASVFGHIAKVLDPDEKNVIIGGPHEDAMPEDAFNELVNNLPTSYEFKRYADYRTAQLVGEYFDTARDFEQDYSQYMTRKTARAGRAHSRGNPTNKLIAAQQLELLQYGLSQLDYLLENTNPSAVHEKEWRDSIYSILKIIFPQYVFAKADVQIPDRIDPSHSHRFIDFLLADARGNIDVLEIKKAFPKSSLIRKRTYRDNYIAAKELTGGVMQIEKYINNLLNWGIDGEKELYSRYKDELPENLDKLRFLNPRGLLIIGYCEGNDERSGFTEREAYDFDLIRRHYSRIVDIITYNDLRDRFQRIISSLEQDLGA